MKKLCSRLLWIGISCAGAWAYVTIAWHHGEHLNSAYILIAALCSYAIGYRFYSKWIAARALMLDDRRATPAEVHDDGKDFVRTNKWIVFGHHFAAISGPGPLVGPVLAAQFGYLPGTLWILIGVTLGGAVQDLVVLFASMRRDGKSLGQMVKEELNSAAGMVALTAILAILVILLAVLALVVVKALAESPWGVFTVGATIPIALMMGCYMRYARVGKVLEATAIGVVLLLLAVWGGKLVYGSPVLKPWFELRAVHLAWAVILYGLAASVLPVWLLLAPRDYLSTFMKLGTICALALGIFCVLPPLQMQAVTRFADGSGPVMPGKIFPFCFITIACGAISGFHTLIASGTTPKLITRESYARPIGYGAMCLESLVAIMALIAACTLQPGVYLSINMPGDPHVTTAAVSALNFPVTIEQMNQLAGKLGENTLFGRTGGATTLAVGMAQIFSNALGGGWMDLWYHFAIMFEALFILTTLDAGTRVGRYLLQEALGNVWKPLGETKSLGANFLASGLIVAAWGWFLIQGVRDPEGGTKALWPLFGIANQMLAAIALCLTTTILLKMGLQRTAKARSATNVPSANSLTPILPRTEIPIRRDLGGGEGRGEGAAFDPGSSRASFPHPALAIITLLPLLWLLAVTLTAGTQKIWHPDPRIGFLAKARALKTEGTELKRQLLTAWLHGDATAQAAAQDALRANSVLRFNNLMDAAVAAIFLILISAIVLLSAREWTLLLARHKPIALRESEPRWLPDYALAQPRSLSVAGLLALALALLKEISGQARLDRASHAAIAAAPDAESAAVNVLSCGLNKTTRKHLYVRVTEERFTGIKRCC